MLSTIRTWTQEWSDIPRRSDCTCAMCHQARTSGSALSPSSSASSRRLPRVGAPIAGGRGRLARACGRARPGRPPRPRRLRPRPRPVRSARGFGHAAILARGDEGPATRHAGASRAGVRPRGAARQPVRRLRRQDARATFAELAAEVDARHGDGEPSARPRRGRLVDATVARFGRRDRRPAPARATPSRPTIPREVGLGGSSAIVIATLRALCALRRARARPGRRSPRSRSRSRRDDLGIAAGPQDRLIQAHEGLLYMDFSELAGGPVRAPRPGALPPLFVAWRRDAAEPSARVHGELRRRYERGDRGPGRRSGGSRSWPSAGASASLDGRAARARRADGRERRPARARLVELDPRHLRMIELAGELGAPANYAGSGGAIVGIVPARTPIGDAARRRSRPRAASCRRASDRRRARGFSA